MIRTFSGLVLSAALLYIAQPSYGTPIAYSFTGTTNQPLDGQTNFTGTFFYDPSIAGNVPKSDSNTGNWSIANYFEQGSGVTPGTYLGMTLNAMGETFTTTHNTRWDDLNISSNGQASNISEQFTLSEIIGGPFQNVELSVGVNSWNTSLLPNLTLPPNLQGFPSGGFSIYVAGHLYTGQFTSFEPIASTEVPEPASALVFAIGCLTAGLYGRAARRPGRRPV